MPTGTLTGKVALVTGGGSGIGRGICVGFAREGAAVCVVDVDPDAARATGAAVEANGARAVTVRANTASLEQMRSAAGTAVDELGGLDIAVANAGIFRTGSLLEMRPSDFQDQLAVNLTGVFYTVRAAAERMVEGGQGGRVICISSEAALSTGARVWSYSATKAGVTMMVRGWAQELGPHGITVNSIAPGLIDTPLARHQAGEPTGELRTLAAGRRPVGRVGVPEDIAALAAFLAGPGAGYITGALMLVDGGARDAHGAGDNRSSDAARAEAHRLRAEYASRSARIQTLSM